MEVRLKLSKEDDTPPVDATEYRGVIGCLHYLVNTRPDIALAVGVTSWYMEAPSSRHWAAVKQNPQVYPRHTALRVHLQEGVRHSLTRRLQ